MKNDYDFKNIDLPRFVHYYDQINLTRSIYFKSVLIIGIGDHIIEDYLKRCGFVVKTFDIDPKLTPDYLGDIRDFNVTEHFDLVIMSEVLEHLDYALAEGIVDRLSRIANYVIISVPYVYIRLLGIGEQGKFRIFGNLFLISDNGVIKTRIPYFFHTPKQYGANDLEHHKWSIGFKKYNAKGFCNILRKQYHIREQLIKYDTNTIFWVLTTKANNTPPQNPSVPI